MVIKILIKKLQKKYILMEKEVTITMGLIGKQPVARYAGAQIKKVNHSSQTSNNMFIYIYILSLCTLNPIHFDTYIDSHTYLTKRKSKQGSSVRSTKIYLKLTKTLGLKLTKTE